MFISDVASSSNESQQPSRRKSGIFGYVHFAWKFFVIGRELNEEIAAEVAIVAKERAQVEALADGEKGGEQRNNCRSYPYRLHLKYSADRIDSLEAKIERENQEHESLIDTLVALEILLRRCRTVSHESDAVSDSSFEPAKNEDIKRGLICKKIELIKRQIKQKQSDLLSDLTFIHPATADIVIERSKGSYASYIVDKIESKVIKAEATAIDGLAAQLSLQLQPLDFSALEAKALDSERLAQKLEKELAAIPAIDIEKSTKADLQKAHKSFQAALHELTTSANILATVKQEFERRSLSLLDDGEYSGQNIDHLIMSIARNCLDLEENLAKLKSRVKGIEEVMVKISDRLGADH